MEKIARTPVAIIGAGSIGGAFAIVFARSGHAVRLFDRAAERLAAAPAEIRAKLDELDRFALLDEPPAVIAQRITAEADLGRALADAGYVQECAPEERALKQQLFAEFDTLAEPTAVLASASSAIPISAIAGDLAGRHRCLVVHPGNPPFLLPVAELVPASFTSAATMDTAERVLTDAGMQPVRLKKEVEGFLFNRLQGAVLREAYCLVRDGVADVAAIDAVMHAGLGRRWAVTGPFATADLNVKGGTVAHAARMGAAYARMGAERGQDDPWSDELVALVAAQRRLALPLDDWADAVAWRDRALMALEACRRHRPDIFDRD